MLVWAYQPLPELEFKTGFVEVPDEALANRLIENDEVQSLTIGHLNFKHITNVPVFRGSKDEGYETNVMKPSRKSTAKKADDV
jgi:hypothetical protein